MKKLTIQTIILLAVMLSLAACQALSNLPAFQAPGSAPQPTAMPLTGDRASQLGATALMTKEQATQSGQTGSLLIPVTAATGKPAPGFEPINIDYYAQYALSPTREQLAYVSIHSADCALECLSFLNLRTWKPEFKPLKISDDEGSWLSNLAFNPEGTRLALALNSQTLGASRLLLVDMTSGTLLKQVSLDTSVYHLGIAPDGSVVLEGSSGARADGSRVGLAMLLDGASLAVKWQQVLEDAVYSTEFATTLPDPSSGQSLDPQDPSFGRYLEPGVVFSPDNTRLYLAAAETLKLITVDFTSRSVSTALIQKPMSWLERLLTAGASVAYGKFMNGTTKSGVISPDGKTLYIAGQNYKMVKDADGNWNEEITSLGLQVVDVASGTLTASLQTEASQLSLSVDGKTLLLNGWTNTNGVSQDWTDLLDVSTLQVTGRIEGQASSSRLLDGSLVYLSNHYRDNGGNDLAIYRPGSQTPLSQWVEPGSYYSAWIIIP